MAEPFNAAAEIAGVGKMLRFSGDVWKDHACCVTFLAERDIADKPEWAQRVTNAVVKAQLWTRDNRLAAARLLSSTGERRYTPHPQQTLSKVLAATDYASYEASGVVVNKGWHQRRIDFQPYPYPSYTEQLVRAIKATKVEGDTRFLDKLEPRFAATDLVDDRFVRKAIQAVGGPQVRHSGRFLAPRNHRGVIQVLRRIGLPLLGAALVLAPGGRRAAARSTPVAAASRPGLRCRRWASC